MLKNQWSKKEIEDSEYEIHHRALSEEYSFFEAVKDGNIEAVSKNLKEEAFTNPEGMGILSKNPLTNLKYHFVVTVALVTRYCIDGGMETEQAYRLSDFYIIHMDACSTIQEISDLHHEMALDFTGKMRLLQKNAALSKPVAQCIDYIILLLPLHWSHGIALTAAWKQSRPRCLSDFYYILQHHSGNIRSAS